MPSADPVKFALQRDRRGMTNEEIASVARKSHRVVARMAAGRPVSVSTFNAVAAALARMPVLPEVDELLAAPDRDQEAAS